MKVELDLSYYATNADLKNATGVDTSDFTKKADLANLKSDIHKVDIDKLKNTPSNLKNLKSKVDKLSKLKKLATMQKLMKLKRKLLIKNLII